MLPSPVAERRCGFAEDALDAEIPFQTVSMRALPAAFFIRGRDSFADGEQLVSCLSLATRAL